MYFCKVKDRIHKSAAIAMALLVVLSTISWTVDKHLCMGRVMDVAFFHAAAPCAMEEAAAAMDDGAMDMPCCEDESFTVTGQDDLKLSWNDLDLDTQVFLNAFGVAYLQLFVDSSDDHLPGETYPPPLLVQDLHTIYEVYLI